MNLNNWRITTVDGITTYSKGRFTVTTKRVGNRTSVIINNGLVKGDKHIVDCITKVLRDVEKEYKTAITVGDVTYYKDFEIHEGEEIVLMNYEDKSVIFEQFRSVQQAMKYIDVNLEE